MNQINFEIFNFAKDIFFVGSDQIVIAEGSGFVTMDKKPGSYATVAELRSDPGRGKLLSGGLFAVVRDDDGNEALIVVRRSQDAQFEPGKLQVPSGRCSPGEAGIDTALREFFEEISITVDGNQISREDGCVSVRSGGGKVYFIPDEGIQRSRSFSIFIFNDENANTLEMIAFADIKVRNLGDVSIVSNEHFHTAHLIHRKDWNDVIPQMTRQTAEAMKAFMLGL